MLIQDRLVIRLLVIDISVLRQYILIDDLLQQFSSQYLVLVYILADSDLVALLLWYKGLTLLLF
jgi:hypothetical protein